jgi:HSP20 family protein
LDIAITRDMVTIKGKRVEQKDVQEDNYVYQELYWGAFARTIVLPAEVDVDMAEASEKHGLLTIRLPKLNKDRQTKLKVKG